MHKRFALFLLLFLGICVSGSHAANINDLWVNSFQTCTGGVPCLTIHNLALTGPWTGSRNLNDLFVNAFADCSGVPCLSVNGAGGGGGSGTVTSIATTSPITGGPITTTGTIACPTCGVTGSPLSQFAATTSAQLLATISDETGSGLAVFNTTPTLVTPILGVATATSINKVILTAPATSATLTIADGKVVTLSNTLTFTGTDSSSVAFGTGGTVAYTASSVASITGTANQVIASGATGAVTLSLPQSIATASTPQFAALGLGNAAGASGVIITSAINNCLTVGPSGTTSPALQVDCSVASGITGLQITPAVSGSGVTLKGIGSGTESLNLDTAGAGNVRAKINGSTRVNFSNIQAVFTPGARTSGVLPTFSFAGGTDTALTAGTEAPDFLVDLSQTKQHASNTTIALQRHARLQPPTDTCASATCTITDDSLLALSGPPTGGTNSLITTSEALLIETRALTNVTNGFGIVVNAPTGAGTKNYAGKFVGDVAMAGHLQSASTIGAVSACGTGASVAGADNSFRVTVGSTVTTSSCTIAFGASFPTAPICSANDETTILLVRAVASTTNVVLTTATAFQNDVIGVKCRGYE